VFADLSDKLVNMLNSLRKKGKLTKEDIDKFLKNLKMVLLASDVGFDVVRVFIKDVRKKLEEANIEKSISPVDQLTKIVYDEMREILGQPVPLKLKPGKLTQILLVGLQGSGKTTTAGKLAYYVKKKLRKSPILVAADTYRPAAAQQLRTLANEVDAGFYSMVKEDGTLDIDGYKKFIRGTLYDVAIIDSAGRMHVDEELMEEIKQLHEALQPDYVFLVADAMLGQEAVDIADAFHKALPISGVILTKVDGDTRGGAALSLRYVTGVPIYFMGMGEKVDALEPFDPDEISARILDLGSAKAFMERIKELEKKLKELERKGKKVKAEKIEDFTLEDLLVQFEAISDGDFVGGLLSSLPGGRQMMQGVDEEEMNTRLKHFKAILQSMTPYERKHPEVLDASRKRRIAAGSGTSVQEVNQLLKQYKQMKKAMKTLSKMMKRGRFPSVIPPSFLGGGGIK